MHLPPVPQVQKGLLQTVQDFFYDNLNVQLSPNCAKLSTDIINKMVPVAYDTDVRFRIDILNGLTCMIENADPATKASEKEYVEWLFNELLHIYFPSHRLSLLESKDLALLAESKNSRILSHIKPHIKNSKAADSFVQHVLAVNAQSKKVSSAQENVADSLAKIQANLKAGNSAKSSAFAIEIQESEAPPQPASNIDLASTLALGATLNESAREYQQRIQRIADNMSAYNELVKRHEGTQKELKHAQELARVTYLPAQLTGVMEAQARLEQQDREFSELLNQAYENKRALPSTQHLMSLKEQLLAKKKEREAELEKKTKEKDDLKLSITNTQAHLKECYDMVHKNIKLEEELMSFYDITSREEQVAKANLERVNHQLQEMTQYKFLQNADQAKPGAGK